MLNDVVLVEILLQPLKSIFGCRCMCFSGVDAALRKQQSIGLEKFKGKNNIISVVPDCEIVSNGGKHDWRWSKVINEGSRKGMASVKRRPMCLKGIVCTCRRTEAFQLYWCRANIYEDSTHVSDAIRRFILIWAGLRDSLDNLLAGIRTKLILKLDGYLLNNIPTMGFYCLT